MLGNRRLGKGQLVDEFATQALTPSSQESEDSNANRVGKGLEEPGQFVVCGTTFDGSKVRLLILGRTNTGQIVAV
jgi:hypothetical protein